MSSKFIHLLEESEAGIDELGGKGASLSRLAKAGLPVPGAFVISTRAYRDFVEQNEMEERIAKILTQADLSDHDSATYASNRIRAAFEAAELPDEIAGAIVDAYSDLHGQYPAVAVRSSATAEDLQEASFAGQQESYLNVKGPSRLLRSVKKCWGSLWTPQAITYRHNRSVDQSNVWMAVVVQLLIEAEVSGIMFTANPVSGDRSEMLINAAWGLGEAVVGGLVSPDTITAAKPDGRVLQRVTAEKELMTVQTEDGTHETQVPENLKAIPVLNDESVARLVQIGLQIEALYEQPMDIEWTLSDGEFAVVQARPISASQSTDKLADPDWKLPEGAYMALRNNIVELMADPLSPLFETLGLSSVNQSMGRQFETFLGSPDVLPEQVIIAVNHYAYYNGSLRPWPTVKMLFDSIGIARRMFTNPVGRWTDQGRPAYIDMINHFEEADWRKWPSIKILEGVRSLSRATIDAYLSLVSGVIPSAWISEAMFTFLYKLLIKRRHDPAPQTFLLGFDNVPIESEKSMYDLAQWIRTKPGLSKQVLECASIELKTRLEESNAEPEGIEFGEFQARFKNHQTRFGHLIYNLDFATPVPADAPLSTIETIKMFVAGEGANPYERQRKSINQRMEAESRIESRLGRLRLKWFRGALGRAQRFAPMREDAIADVGMAYPLLRRMLFELGHRLVQEGWISTADDIFWLHETELVEAFGSMEPGKTPEAYGGRVSRRKQGRKQARLMAPPLFLPHKILGISLAKGTSISKRDVLKGVGASSGRIEARACVLSGPEDFYKMREGDVLVASITTPAWTPLFARAGAVVTDVGGPLSHGSIVAREYGIPAVLGTGTATTMIKEGDRITVDGSAGRVYLAN